MLSALGAPLEANGGNILDSGGFLEPFVSVHVGCCEVIAQVQVINHPKSVTKQNIGRSLLTHW